MKSKVILVTRNLPPMIGGMERLNLHMAIELANHHDLTVIGPEPASPFIPKIMAKFIGLKLKPLWFFLISSIFSACYIAIKTKPQIILAGSGLSAVAALLAARFANAKCVTYVHGLDIAVQNPIYKLIWLNAIKKMDLIIANSHMTAEITKNLCHVDEKKISVIHPGTERPRREANIQEIEQFKSLHGLEGTSILLSIGRITDRKGLIEFVTCCLPRILVAHPNAVLLVIGTPPSNSLHAKGVDPEAIIEAARRLGIEKHIKFLGAVDEQILHLALYASSVHIFPIKEIKGDPEGFGMVAIEAAIHGLPTVAFATGGVSDAVKNNVSGYLIPPQSYDLFSESVLSILKDRNNINKEQCVNFGAQFEWHKFGEKLQQSLRTIK